MRKKLIIVLLLLAVLSGCASFWNREVYEPEPHSEQSGEQINPDELTANSYASLKNVILSLVRNGIREGEIKIPSYPGDAERVEQELSAILSEIQNEEPLGVYAVDYMSSKLTRVLTRYTVNIYITYRRTPEEIAGVRQISGYAGLLGEMRDTLRSYGESIVMETYYYDAAKFDIDAVTRSEYYGFPEYALGYPEISVSVYPETGLHRIIEVHLEYAEEPDEQQRRQTVCELAVNSIAAKCSGLSDREALLAAHGYLAEAITYDGDTAMQASFTGERQNNQSYTIYGAFVENRAVSEGYALALKAVCDALKIECRVIIGRMGGDERVWNLVRLEGRWHHVDTAAGDISSGLDYSAYLCSDSDMETMTYKWQTDLYPAAPENGLDYENPETEDPSVLDNEDIQ